MRGRGALFLDLDGTLADSGAGITSALNEVLAAMGTDLLLEDALAFIENKHGSRPHNDACWMIGDRHHDIDAATEVGTKSVGVLWGYGDEAELMSAGATAIARNPADLLDILM